MLNSLSPVYLVEDPSLWDGMMLLACRTVLPTPTNPSYTLSHTWPEDHLLPVLEPLRLTVNTKHIFSSGVWASSRLAHFSNFLSWL